jgi:cyclohexyl-isocyanide hydratase
MTLLQIGFLVYPGIVQLDVMAAYQVLSFPPNTQLHPIWKTLDSIAKRCLEQVDSNEGLIILILD